MAKNKTDKTKRFSPKTFIKKLLCESGFPKTKEFYVQSKAGRLVVRFNKNNYE
jgi:hypothetical protein